MIASSLEDSLGHLIEGEDEARASLAVEIALYVALFVDGTSGSWKDREEWTQLGDRIRRNHSVAIGRLVRSRLNLAKLELKEGQMDADEFLERFGPGGFFTETQLTLIPNAYFWSVVNICLRSIAKVNDPAKNPWLTRRFSELATLGRAAINRGLPWFDRDFSTNFSLAV